MSQSLPCCIVDGLHADEAILTLLDGAWYCSTHAKCATCGKPFGENVQTPRFMTCSCADYGATCHEESAWCSLECMEEAHPDGPDWEPEEDET